MFSNVLNNDNKMLIQTLHNYILIYIGFCFKDIVELMYNNSVSFYSLKLNIIVVFNKLLMY